jgi:hypothetical protein
MLLHREFWIRAEASSIGANFKKGRGQKGEEKPLTDFGVLAFAALLFLSLGSYFFNRIQL